MAELKERMKRLEAENSMLKHVMSTMRLYNADDESDPKTLALLEEIEALENKLQKYEDVLFECMEEIDRYIWQKYPPDHPVHERYRKRDLSANPARVLLEGL